MKIDDIGLYLSKTAALRSLRALGRPLVIAMPTVLKVISVVGTAAMLWVGGSIVVHSLHTLHLSWPYELTTSMASAVTGEGASAVSWLVTAFLDAVWDSCSGRFDPGRECPARPDWRPVPREMIEVIALGGRTSFCGISALGQKPT